MWTVKNPVVRGVIAAVAAVAASTTGAATMLMAADAHYVAVVVSDSPIGYFRLGDAGPSVADVTGHATGTASGAVTFGVPGVLVGNPDTAAAFAGGSIKTTLLQQNVRQYTLEAWIKTSTNASGAMTVFSSSRTGVDKGFAMFVGPVWPTASAGRVTFALTNNSTVFIGVHSQRTVNDGRWHHVVGVYDTRAVPNRAILPDEFSIYIDGILEANNVEAYYDCCQTTVPVSGDPTGTLIGGFANPSMNFSGQIDEAAIYKQALSPERIRAHYRAGLPSPGPSRATECDGDRWADFGFSNAGLCVSFLKRDQ